MVSLATLKSKKRAYTEAKLKTEHDIHAIMVKFNPTLAMDFLVMTSHMSLNIKAFIGGFNECTTKDLLVKLSEERELLKNAIKIVDEMIELRREIYEA